MLYRRAILLFGDLQDGRRTDALTAETLSDFGTEAIRTTGVMPARMRTDSSPTLTQLEKR
jgi:hypothetical protein